MCLILFYYISTENSNELNDKNKYSPVYTYCTVSSHSPFLPPFVNQHNTLCLFHSSIFMSMLSLIFFLHFCQFRVHGNKTKAGSLGTHGVWACAVIWQWHGKPTRSAELWAHVCWTDHVCAFIYTSVTFKHIFHLCLPAILCVWLWACVFSCFLARILAGHWMYKCVFGCLCLSVLSPMSAGSSPHLALSFTVYKDPRPWD